MVGFPVALNSPLKPAPSISPVINDEALVAQTIVIVRQQPLHEACDLDPTTGIALLKRCAQDVPLLVIGLAGQTPQECHKSRFLSGGERHHGDLNAAIGLTTGG